MKQGGLCMALGETCCFYANNLRVIRESLALVRKNLEERERKSEPSETWFQSMFN